MIQKKNFNAQIIFKLLEWFKSFNFGADNKSTQLRLIWSGCINWKERKIMGNATRLWVPYVSKVAKMVVNSNNVQANGSEESHKKAGIEYTSGGEFLQADKTRKM